MPHRAPAAADRRPPARPRRRHRQAVRKPRSPHVPRCWNPRLGRCCRHDRRGRSRISHRWHYAPTIQTWSAKAVVPSPNRSRAPPTAKPRHDASKRSPAHRGDRQDIGKRLRAPCGRVHQRAGAASAPSPAESARRRRQSPVDPLPSRPKPPEFQPPAPRPHALRSKI